MRERLRIEYVPGTRNWGELPTPEYYLLPRVPGTPSGSPVSGFLFLIRGPVWHLILIRSTYLPPMLYHTSTCSTCQCFLRIFLFVWNNESWRTRGGLRELWSVSVVSILKSYFLIPSTAAGVPGGLVGYPRAYQNQFREFNYH